MNTSFEAITRVSRRLEAIVVAFAIAALTYRASFYWMLPAEEGEPFGLGDIIDFGLGLALFFLSLLCSVLAVVLSAKSQGRDQYLAFRPAVIGITTFVLYYFLHPHVPRLI